MKKINFILIILGLSLFSAGCTSESLKTTDQPGTNSPVKVITAQDIRNATTTPEFKFIIGSSGGQSIEYKNDIFKLALPSTYKGYKVYKKDNITADFVYKEVGVATDLGKNVTGYFFNLPVTNPDFMPEVGEKGNAEVFVIYIIPRAVGEAFKVERNITVKADKQYYAGSDYTHVGAITSDLYWDELTFQFVNTSSNIQHTYISNKYHFQISYPVSWYIMESDYGYIDFVDTNSKNVKNGTFENVIHIVVKDPSSKEVSEDTFFGKGVPDSGSNEKDEIFAGQNSIKFSIPGFMRIGFGQRSDYEVTSIGARYISNSFELINQILSTFKFIK